MAFTREQIDYVAHLARIDLTEAERDLFGAQLASILAYFAKLDELDTSDVEPTAHAMGLSYVFREDAEQPWTLAKATKTGDQEAGARLKAALADLVEACRLIGLAAAPFVPTAAPRVLAQLGYDYPYGADGNGGPALLDELKWGARSAATGRVATPEPLFPRIETEAATTAAD